MPVEFSVEKPFPLQPTNASDAQRNEPTCIDVRFKNTTLSFVSAIRRVILSDLPTIAIDQVEVLENSSVLDDEMIALRLGFTPIVSEAFAENIDALEFPWDCDCATGCNKCRISYAINVECSTSEQLPVTQDDIKLLDDNPGFIPAPVPVPTKSLRWDPSGKATVTEGPIDITRLGPKQKLHINCMGRKGTGKLHAKWMPTSNITLRRVPTVRLNHEVLNDILDSHSEKNTLANFVTLCPKGVFEHSDIAGTLTVVNEDACVFCQNCTDHLPEPEMKDLATVEMKDDEFVLAIEATGAIRADNLIPMAIEIIHKKVQDIQDHVRRATGGGDAAPEQEDQGYGGGDHMVQEEW